MRDPRILVVEDEHAIAEFLATELKFEGFDVLVEHDGMRGLMAARQSAPDLIVLDRMLPGLDGVEVCRRLRSTSDVPIIMLTAKGEVPDKVEGLNAGANDYLAKPFHFEELLARIKAQLRAQKPEPKTRFALADLSLDTKTREVLRGDRPVELTPREFGLLEYLIRHPRQVLTRSQILESVWGYEFNGDDGVLEVYIRYLRTKLEREGLPRLIHTARGVGYVLKEGEAR
jgi:two-component system OmpR family response regulator